MRRVPPSGGYTPRIYPFDAALTYYLVGKVSFCLDILDDFASEDLRPVWVDIHLSARDWGRKFAGLLGRLDSDAVQCAAANSWLTRDEARNMPSRASLELRSYKGKQFHKRGPCIARDQPCRRARVQSPDARL